ncbi:uncharacterized protein involved in exopolysaccharide biosynthesis [Pedobacter sp. CAN_A7]|uniref:Wzz/FepE/Etk N-terminal domain-containing protein n=1 Tax=Pedobacter sp. CAN_A7 TaxID=2787722 RepID=UPI0018CA480B
MKSEPIIDSNKSDEITLKEFLLKIQEWFKYLLSKWLTIILIAILGGIIGFAIAYVDKPTFTATTTFVLEEGVGSANQAGGMGGLASMAGIDLGGTGGGLFESNSILELYKSRTMIEKTLFTEIRNESKNEILINQYIDFNNLKDRWKESKNPALVDFQFTDSARNTSVTRLQDSIVGAIVADIQKNYLVVTKPDKKVSLFKVEIKSPDELFAKNFNDQIVKNVNDFYVQTKTKKSLENVNVLQQQADSVRKVMNGEIYRSAAVLDATPNLNPTRQVQRVAPVERSKTSAETNKVILSELLRNLEMSRMTLLKEMPLIQVVDQPIYPLEKEQSNPITAAIIGAILIGFLTVIVLLLNKIIKDVLV